jgi:hypothetical protein
MPAAKQSCESIGHTNHDGTDLYRYLFLIERNRILRAPYTSRLRDWLWLVATTAVVAGFGSIAAFGFNWRRAYLAQPAGRCWIGLPLCVTMLLLVFDVCINFFLTLSFFYLIRHLVTRDLPYKDYPASRFADWFGRVCSRESSQRSVELRRENPNAARQTERLLWKTLTGCVLAVLPTLANLMTMGLLDGVESLWLCFTACTLDGIARVVVVVVVERADTHSDLDGSRLPLADNGRREHRRRRAARVSITSPSMSELTGQDPGTAVIDSRRLKDGGGPFLRLHTTYRYLALEARQSRPFIMRPQGQNYHMTFPTSSLHMPSPREVSIV